LAVVLIGLGLSVPAARAQEPQDKARPAKSLTVIHDGNWTEKLALVTVYLEGQPYRSAELQQGSMEHGAVTWEKLRSGVYEVHFEAAGFKRFVKRVVLADDAPGVVLRVQLDITNAYTLGGGPSAERLAQEVAALKKEQAELRKQVSDLQAEVTRLKK
jgi:hypothetical protein